MESNGFLIQLDEIPGGEAVFEWKAGKDFFESFENEEVIDAQLDINTILRKAGGYVTVDCKVVGELTLTCDRCAEDLVMPIDVAIALNVRFGQEEEVDDDVRETIFIPAGESALDLSQTIYDYVCLSLPLQRVHPEGGCSQAALKYLGGEADAEVADSSPFASLKHLLQ